MSMRALIGSPWGLFASLVLVPATGGTEPVPPGQFEKLHRLIKPHTGEQKWEQVPWLADLWEARRRAAEQGKPILLWEMDGHPLGCT
jgi:hypothetical protein